MAPETEPLVSSVLNKHPTSCTIYLACYQVIGRLGLFFGQCLRATRASPNDIVERGAQGTGDQAQAGVHVCMGCALSLQHDPNTLGKYFDDSHYQQSLNEANHPADVGGPHPVVPLWGPQKKELCLQLPVGGSIKSSLALQTGLNMSQLSAPTCFKPFLHLSCMRLLFLWLALTNTAPMCHLHGDLGRLCGVEASSQEP